MKQNIMKNKKTYFFGFLALLVMTLYPHSKHSFDSYRELFEDKTICITGGTGFIGRTLLKQILQFNPKKVVIVSRDEVKHYKIQKKFRDHRIQSIVGDVRDYNTMLMVTKGVDMVLHTAALKRIDMLEFHTLESIYTNVQGTINVARACMENNVATALLVSTDKACSPINTYGACKFLAEKIFTNFGAPNESTRFIVVRYGNVLKSTGSVIPFFCEKIKNNKPVPLTDERMTRFFISKQQAIELIFKALKYGHGGEVFVPRIPSFKITDLIHALQDKIGITTPIEVIGLRPGEKIHELMINETEVPRTYVKEDLYIITPSVSADETRKAYAQHGRKLTLNDLHEYSSGTSLLSKEDLIALLDAYLIVKK